MGWFSDAWEAVEETVEDVVDEAEELVEDVADAAEDFGDDVSDTWHDAFSGLRTAAEEGGPFGFVVALAGGVAAGVTGTAGAFGDFVGDVGGAFADATTDVAGAIAGGTIQILAEGVTGGRAPDNIGDSIQGAFDAIGDGLQWLSHKGGDFTERTFDAGASFIIAGTTRFRCTTETAVKSGLRLFEVVGDSGESKPRGLAAINHIFVLMLENRSFDHMLGQSAIAGVDGVLGGTYRNRLGQQWVIAGGDARLELRSDPPHEFSPVQRQIRAGTNTPMSGFASEFDRHILDHPTPPPQERAEEVMYGFSPKRLPVLHALAQEFAVCDRWFSSLPGPTLPNRLFVHAATSGGLADSPSSSSLAWATTCGGFEFDAGTVFDHLSQRCVPWAIYAGDAVPLVLTLKNIVVSDAVSGWSRIRPMALFGPDLANADESFPSYVFIEPRYGRFWSDFKWGNSQHPLDSVDHGEELVKEVFEAISSSPIWPTSALVITYDEHGGFFDHVPPPAADPPGDSRAYESWAEDPAARAFQFDRLGVRVPAVIASAWVKRGTVDHVTRDHSTIIATLADRFDISTLTERGDWAPSLDRVFSRSSPRLGSVRLPDPFRG